jgi:hypothetical protein
MYGGRIVPVRPTVMPTIGIYDREGYSCCTATCFENENHLCCCYSYQIVNDGIGKYITVGKPPWEYGKQTERSNRERWEDQFGGGSVPPDAVYLRRGESPYAATFSRTAPPSDVAVSAEMWTALIEDLEAGFAGSQSSWEFFSYWGWPCWIHEYSVCCGPCITTGCCCGVEKTIMSTTQTVVEAHKARFAAAGVELQLSNGGRLNPQRWINTVNGTGAATKSKDPYAPVRVCYIHLSPSSLHSISI